MLERRDDGAAYKKVRKSAVRRQSTPLAIRVFTTFLRSIGPFSPFGGGAAIAVLAAADQPADA